MTLPAYFVRPKRVPPDPEDPFEDGMPRTEEHAMQQLVPPTGAIESDDPLWADRYSADQLTLSIAQVYDTAWPVAPDPTSEYCGVGYQGTRLYRP